MEISGAQFYAHKFQKLIYDLHLYTDCFMKIFPQSSEQIKFCSELYLFQ